MIDTTIAVLTPTRSSRRQIARALYSGGISTVFEEDAAALTATIQVKKPDLVILDCDERTPAIEDALAKLGAQKNPPPVILLSTRADKTPLLDLVRDNDISNLIAKHGAVRAVFPMMDERELLTTCEKVLRKNIFGIEKYVGSWGVVCHSTVITSLKEKAPTIDKFSEFLVGLDCPKSIIPAILTVADELIVNAVVHAPHHPDGTPKYEDRPPSADIELAPNEHVTVSYGCDGQRLMLSVSDNFGRLTKKTLYGYLARNFGSDKLAVEEKVSGAGLGLTMAYRNLHQMIINVQEMSRTEAIAGWYLRVNSGSEFRQIAKSFNLFWLPANAKGIEAAIPSVVATTKAPAASMPTFQLRGQIDEATDFSVASTSAELDLRHVNRITSRGILRWLSFIKSTQWRGLTVRALPEPMVRLAADISGILEGVKVKTVMAPFECANCNEEQDIELPVGEIMSTVERTCPKCSGKNFKFAALKEPYARLAGEI